MEANRRRTLKADLALLGVTLIWGVTFTVIKEALAGIGPYYFLGIRFSLAGLFLVLIFVKRVVRLDRRTLIAGAFIGVLLFAGYAFQTVGLKYTSASNAGFITGLSVVLVPLMGAAMSRRLPGNGVKTGVAGAAGGLAALSLGDDLSIGYGDMLVSLCAVSFALQIILVGRYAPRHDPVNLAIVQIGTVAVASLTFAFFLESPPASLNGDVWAALLITALPATAIAFLVQNTVQKFTTPNHTAIIFTMEPVFAAACARLFWGEVMAGRQYAGCLLILAGMLIAELKDHPD
ncbi:MAG: DMT family transporter [Firmicutes bacterium]|nr:DMT family transporter [Bacillota bacterium]